MASAWTVDRLQALFKDKLQERFKLNIRDLKKAFGKFDKDNNGLLDLSEVSVAIRSFLNGVPDKAIEDLVAFYDTSGDGKISYDEFLAILLSKESLTKQQASPRPTPSDALRAAPSRQATPPPPPPQAQRPRPQQQHDIPPAPPSTFSTVEESALDVTNPKEMEARLETYLYSLKAQFMKQAVLMRQAGKAGNLGDRLSLSSTALLEGIARSLVTKAFQQYTGAGDGRTRGGVAGVEMVRCTSHAKGRKAACR